MIKKRSPKKIPAHYGLNDYYKFYKKNSDDPINSKLYSSIIGEFNKSIINLILNDNMEYNIPELHTTINIRKDKRQPKIIDGKLYHNAPINWVATNTLWSTNKEAKDSKLLVRYINNLTSGYVYRIHLNRFGKNYKSKPFYKFKPTRFFQRSLAKRINDTSKSKFDAYLLYNNKK